MSQAEPTGSSAPAVSSPRPDATDPASAGSDALVLGAPERLRRSRGLPGLTLLASELRVLFGRRRTQAMLLTLALVPVLIAVAVRISSGEGGPPFLDRISQNGLFVSLTAMTVCIPLFLPLTIGVVAGDTLAGEANQGTLRYLLVAPAGRLRLLVVKYLGAAAFCLAATVVVALAGALIGAVLFPVGPVTLLSGDTVGLAGYAARMLLLAGYVTLSMLGLSAVGLFISTLTTVPVGAMAATVVVAVASQILDQLPQLEVIHPWLLSHYWLGFADLLRSPIALGNLADNALLQLAYVAVFGTLAYGRFATKDVLS